MNDLTDYLLGQLQQTATSLQSDVREIKTKLDDLTTWSQRLALLVVLWLAGIASNVAPDQVGEIVAKLLKSLK